MNGLRWLGALGCAGVLALTACSNSAATGPDGPSSGGAGSSGAGGGGGGAAGETPPIVDGGAGGGAGEGVPGADGGAAGSDAGAAGGGGGGGGRDAGGAGGSIAQGSPGCGHPAAADDRLGLAVSHTVEVPGLAEVYLAGGTFAQTSGSFDLSHRPYGLRLPAAYDPNRAWPVIVEATPCGIDAATWAALPQQGNGAPAPPKDAIVIYLIPVKTCLLPGGPTIGNRTDSPDVPYFRAALADAEKSACVDQSRVTIAGFGSSAGREAEMLGCAAGDVVRAVTAVGGGLLAHRPACKGQVAAMLVAPMNDASNPVGPVEMTDPFFMQTDSLGSLPLRDEFLQRNGCTGTDTEQWNAAFPLCVRFRGCPAATPVVWCPIPSMTRTPGNAGGVRYAPDGWWSFATMLPDAP